MYPALNMFGNFSPTRQNVSRRLIPCRNNCTLPISLKSCCSPWPGHPFCSIMSLRYCRSFRAAGSIWGCRTDNLTEASAPFFSQPGCLSQSSASGFQKDIRRYRWKTGYRPGRLPRGSFVCESSLFQPYRRGILPDTNQIRRKDRVRSCWFPHGFKRIKGQPYSDPGKMRWMKATGIWNWP